MSEQLDLIEESAKLRHDAQVTSRLAALKATPRSGTTRRNVLLAIIEARPGGLCDDEIAHAVHLSPNTVRPRRLELVEGGWLVAGNREAVTDYGNKAIAWVPTEKAYRELRA